jgi:hypothetical protein
MDPDEVIVDLAPGVNRVLIALPDGVLDLSASGELVTDPTAIPFLREYEFVDVTPV